MYHLRIHNAPILPELTRAVNHAVVTRSIMRGMGVGNERLRYTLNLIAKIEGGDVSKQVDRTVYRWRQFVKSHCIQLRRVANPLRVGPID
jgi:hypothetical protein